jgi:hypothetical protein
VVDKFIYIIFSLTFNCCLSQQINLGRDDTSFIVSSKNYSPYIQFDIKQNIKNVFYFYRDKELYIKGEIKDFKKNRRMGVF